MPLAELTALNEQLLRAADRLSRRLFGKSSEQLDSNQLELLLGELAPLPAPATFVAEIMATTRKPSAGKSRGACIADSTVGATRSG